MRSRVTTTLLSVTIAVLSVVNVILLVAGVYLSSMSYQKLPFPHYDDRTSSN